MRVGARLVDGTRTPSPARRRRWLGVAGAVIAVLEATGAGLVTAAAVVGMVAAGAPPAGAASSAYGWTTQATAPVGLSSVSCPSSTTCWAVGSQIEVTTSSGLIWSAQSEPGGVGGLASVSCVSTTTCWAAGSGAQGGAVIATTDAGQTWSNETLPSGTPSLSGISCVSSTDCWAVSSAGNIVATTDGGSTWSAQTTPPGVNALTGISCASASNCWAVGSYSTSTTTVAVVISTTNGGTLWSAESSPSSSTTSGGTSSGLPVGLPSFASVSCVAGTTNCVAAAAGPSATSADPNPPTTELLSTTGGQTWTEAAPPSSTATYDTVLCESSSDCWAAGSGGAMAFSSDGGTTWTAQSISYPGTATPENLSGIACASTSACWAVGAAGTAAGSSGLVISTTDGGTSWDAQQTYPLSGVINGISCTSSSDCWIVGGSSAGTVSQTTDSGATWSALAPDLYNPTPKTSSSVEIKSYSAIACVAAGSTQTDCWAVGVDANSNAEIDATTDGGQKWSLQGAPGGITGLTAIACPSTSDCWATSSGGSIISTNDGGSSWTTETVPSGIASLAAIACPNTSQCFAAGSTSNGSPLMLATANGGASWSTQTLPSSVSSVTAIACPSSTNCFAVDSSGDIVGTTDGGSAWAVEAAAAGDASSYAAITCVSVSDCWVAGQGPSSGSVVVATTDGGSAWASEITPPAPRTPTGIACANSNDCWLVGAGAIAATTNGGFSPAPVVTQVSPDAGVDSGGTAVTISGQNFLGASAVDFGSAPAASYRVVNATTIDAQSPAVSGPESVDVTVVTNGGTSALSPSDKFDFVSPTPKPDVTGVSPSSGPLTGGEAVVISGLDFAGATVVAFGPNVVTKFTVNPSGTAITTTVPGGSLGAVNVTVTTAGGGTGPPNSSDAFVYVASGGYTPLAPTRICDTRAGNATQCSGSTLGPDGTLNIQVAGIVSSIPSSGVVAVVMNVTAVDPSANGFLTVSPTGVALPLASNLNFTAGEIVPNLVEVELGLNGEVSFYNGSPGDTNVVADVEGYVSSSPASTYVPLAPQRICDTRPGNPSNLSGPDAQCNNKPISAGKSLVVYVSGLSGLDSVPSGATAVVLNVTMVDPSINAYMTVYPGGTLPTASNLNGAAGKIVANRVITPVSSSGTVDIYSSADVNVTVDVSGYFSSSATGGSSFTPEPPTRILDTRCSASPPPGFCSKEDLPGANTSIGPVGPAQSITVQVGGVGGVPLTATAVVANVTVAGTVSGGFLTVYPGGTLPTVSDVNWTGPGEIVPNLVVVKLSSSGTITIYNNSGTVDVLVDVLGWYQ